MNRFQMLRSLRILSRFDRVTVGCVREGDIAFCNQLSPDPVISITRDSVLAHLIADPVASIEYPVILRRRK